MERKMIITPAVTPPITRKRVAAYARVSLGTAHMLHSLAAQVSHYSRYIQSRSDWDYVGVYADADETGTKENRPEFMRLLSDCRAGLIDMIVTKSISRFARNTVTLLTTVRELKEHGIGVWFEEQNIDSLSGDGELMLTILASYAQEESRSVSENIKWRKRNDMKHGKTKPTKAYGYDLIGQTLVVLPEQAEVVRMMFADYLGGMGQTAIAGKLNALGVPSAWGKTWSSATVRRVLTNPKMCGNLLHQRSYTVDHLSKTQKRNHGELPMYLMEGTHEGIISAETFDAVQEEMARRGRIGGLTESMGLVFRGKIACSACGRNFHHTSTGRGACKCRAWICGGRDKRTGANCTMLQIPEPTLMTVSAAVLGLDEFDGAVFSERIQRIIALPNRGLTFVFQDGSGMTTKWGKRKSDPYSIIGKEKRAGRNICYSKCGKGNYPVKI